MNERSSATVWPASDREMLIALQPLCADATQPAHGLTIVGRRSNAYTSSSRSEIVTVQLPSGTCRELLV